MKRRPFNLILIRGLVGGCCLLLAWRGCLAQTPAFSIGHVDGGGFDVVAGSVHVPISLAANGALTAGQVVSNANGATLSQLQAKDPNAVVFAASDFVSLTLPTPGSAPEPVVSFQLTFEGFDQTRWNALFPSNEPAPFHFLVCSMPMAQVWHQRGWLNATPLADSFPLLLDPHNGTPEISCLWNRNWGYICSLAGHSIPMIGLWDPAQSLYFGYDFQDSRTTWAQSESQVATVYCWQAGASSNFIALAYPSGGSRYGNQTYPAINQCISASFSLVIETNLPATEDPNARFQDRLFTRYTNALPRVPAMNDLAWIPGVARLDDFIQPVGTELYGAINDPDYFTNGTVALVGFKGYREMPVDAWLQEGISLGPARSQLDTLLNQYAQHFYVGGDACLYWSKPLEGAWLPAYGDTNATTLHNAEGWFAARVLVELYRYDLARGTNNTFYSTNIDALFNWAKHFVWTRGEIHDVPSSPFAIGVTLEASFLLDYYFTFKTDPVRGANAAEALSLAQNLVWRYLSVWAMDSDFWDGPVDSAFLAEPNSGRDWAGLGCANEMSEMLDTLVQVYVHTGDERMRFYLRGMLQRWPTLYRADYEPSLADFTDFNDGLTEGYGLVPEAGPGRGGRYDYGFTEPLALMEPVGNSILRVVAGDAAAIAFNKGGTAADITNYRTSGNGACSFTIVSTAASNFDVSFSYPFVNISTNTVTRNGQTLGAAGVSRPVQSPSSLYIFGVANGDTITVGSPAGNTPPYLPDASLVYAESAVQPMTNGSFVTLPLAGNCLLPQDWTDFHSFAGIVPGLHWIHGVPYQQRLHAATNVTALAAPPAYAIFVAYSPPEAAPLGQEPELILDSPFINGSSNLALNGTPVLAWRGWPTMFDRMVLLDYALAPAGHAVTGVDPQGCLVMGATLCTDNSTNWQWVQSGLSSAAAAWVKDETALLAQAALQNFFSQSQAGRIALLPAGQTFDYRGPALDFAGTNGLACRWTALSPAQYADTNLFNATLFPLAFYMGDDDYYANVNTNGDGRAALLNFLQGGGTLVVMSPSPSPLYYACDAGQDTGPTEGTNGLLCSLGLPWVHYDAAPANAAFQIDTNEATMPNLNRSFPFPQSQVGAFGLIDPTQVQAADSYVSWISLTNGSLIGDAACCIQFHQGRAANGTIVYISNALLKSPQSPVIMADAVSWLCQAVPGGSPPWLDSIQFGSASVLLGFNAQPNLDYRLEYTDDLRHDAWTPLQDVPGTPTNRLMSVNDPSKKSGARFYRLRVHP